MKGDGHGSDTLQKVVCVFDVTGVPAGEWVEVVFNEFCNCIGFAPTVRDNGSTWRNNTGNSPSLGVLVYFGEQVKESGSGVIGSV